MKRYKLLKDLPTFNAGDEFVVRDNGCLYLNKVDAVAGYLTGVGHWKNDVMAYHKRTLEQFPNILEDWFEEIEEPKEHFVITCDGKIITTAEEFTAIDECKEIGNYFETEEEAELALRKLKAWKRLKDKGFRFEGIKEDYTRILQSQTPFRTGKRYLQFNKSEDKDWMKENWEDLDLLFSQEDE